MSERLKQIRLKLSQLEVLMASITRLKADEDFDPSALAMINGLKNQLNSFSLQIDKIRNLEKSESKKNDTNK